MKNTKRWGALLLAMATAASLVLAGCGGTSGGSTSGGSTSGGSGNESSGSTSGGAETDNAGGEDVKTVNVTYYIGSGVDTQFAEVYADLPAVQYHNNMVWDVDGTPTKVVYDYTEAPADSISDNLNTMIATGEYPEIMNISMASTTAAALYDEGIALDITEYVEKYMPNYLSFQDAHPEFKGQLTNGGKYIQLYTLADSQEPPWGGWNYRRDWLVEYGKNPETGEAFTGGWTDDSKTDWEDDVVFPSGNTDPITISDWEWMFDVFATALEELGIEDGYAFQNYYTGWESMGEINSGFGGMFGYYIGEDGAVHNGYKEDGARAFIECMHYWYEQGWMNQNFEENSADVMWFNVDSSHVYAGKVGMWYGLQAQLGNGLGSNSDDPLLADCCIFGAAEPMNDKYGDASVQNIEPRCYYATALAGTGVVLTDKINEEDLPAICTSLDYLFGQEGGMLRRWGFSKELYEELQDPFYTEYGMTNGAYTTTEENGTTIYHIDPDIKKVDGLSECLGLIRVTGISPFLNVDYGNSPVKQRSLDQQMLYPAEGNLYGAPVVNQMTPDQSTEWSTLNSTLSTYLQQVVPDFITGRKDITDDAAWQEYLDTLDTMQADLYPEMLNEILGK